MVKHGGILALTDDAVLPLRIVCSLLAELQNEKVEQNEILIITQSSALRKIPVEPNTVDVVISFCKSLDFSSGGLLMEISRVMKPDGRVLVKVAPHAISSPRDESLSSLQRQLLVAGFVQPEPIPLKGDDVSGIQPLVVKAKKPSWKIGSSFSIKVAPKSLPKLQIDDSDLIDEDSLLTEEDLKKPQLPVVGDCEVGSTRKACKNCTCGRAEAEEKAVKLGLTAEQLNNPQSACGNCGLGDAFRCSTCPYRGLPPFELGQKVSLSENFLVADL
ncbi:hypothetical protein Ancab_029966 [Ancistrocladus abbreviatus]